jgi:predicted phage terminase large subunit-like protein
VRIVKARWNRPFLKELTRFPFAAHDDQVDAVSGAFDDLTTRAGKAVSW